MIRKQRTSQFKGYVIVAVFLSVFCLFDVAEGRQNSSNPDDICLSKECYRAVDTIKLNRKPGVKPCDDFYKFACGGWQARIPPELQWDQFTTALNVTIYRVKAILESEDKLNDLKSIKNARKYYRSCLSTHEHAEQNMQRFMQGLSSWGGWPMITKNWLENGFNWQKLLVNIERNLELSPFIEIIVDIDRKNTKNRFMISIDSSDLPFCPYVFFMEDREELKEMIIATALEFAKMNKRILNSKQVNKDAENILNLTEQLCGLKNKAGLPQSDLELNNTRTIRELQELTNALNTTKVYSKINWVELINDFLDGSIARVNENETVIVNNIDYILQVMRIVDELSQRELANYMLFHKIASRQKYLSTILSDFTNFDFSEKTYDEQMEEEKEWWLECVEDTRDLFEHAIGYEYVKLHFDKTSKEKATELVRFILDSFIENLESNDWMDEETRRKAVEKAENIYPVIGYPEWYTNTSRIEEIYSEMNITETSPLENLEKAGLGLVFYSAKLLRRDVFPSDFATGAADINAAYLRSLNAISIPAALFQPPFYLSGRPEALNYGAIGAIIGHELTHAFDIGERMADKDGNLVDWWTSDTLQRYLEREKCFEKQYEDYIVPELNGQTEITHLDGKGTVRENIADNGGLKVAIQAYKKYVSHHGKEKHLPVLKKYTSEQLFFIGYATVWCEQADDEELIRDIIWDEHTPNKYRALIPLSNSEEFSKAWSCPKGSKLNPSKKCHFW